MDIYQILTEYNNPWSSREIFCFSCIMVIAVIMMIYFCLLYTSPSPRD